MQVKNNVYNQQNFGSLRIKNTAIKTMIEKNEWNSFKQCLPEMQRRAKKSNIVLCFRKGNIGRNTSRGYAFSISPKNTLFDNPITRFLGIAKKKQSGKSHFEDRCWRKMSTNDFICLYNEAYKNKIDATRKIKKLQFIKKEISTPQL